MNVKFVCNCGKRLKVGNYKAGNTVFCPTCQDKVQLPPLNSSNIMSIEDENGEVISTHSQISTIANKPTKNSHPSNATLILWVVCMFITIASFVYIFLNIDTLKNVRVLKDYITSEKKTS